VRVRGLVIRGISRLMGHRSTWMSIPISMVYSVFLRLSQNGAGPLCRVCRESHSRGFSNCSRGTPRSAPTSNTVWKLGYAMMNAQPARKTQGPVRANSADAFSAFEPSHSLVNTVRWLIARTGLLVGGLCLRDWMTNLPEGGASNRRTMLSSGLFVPP
jgi:hypothetical protein